MLAFNTIGWKPSNVLFAAVDALLGDPLISTAFGGASPAATSASITDSTVAAAAVLVDATSTAKIAATVSNAATSAPAAIMGAGGMAAAIVIASLNGQRHGRGDDRPHAGDGHRGRDGHRRRRRRDRVRHLADGRGDAHQRPGGGHPEPLRRPDPQRVPVHDALGDAAGALRRARARRRRRRAPVHGHRRLAGPGGAGLHRLRAVEDADRAQPAQRRRDLRRAQRPRHGARARRARLGQGLLRADRSQRRRAAPSPRRSTPRRSPPAGTSWSAPPSPPRSPRPTPASSRPGRATARSS